MKLRPILFLAAAAKTTAQNESNSNLRRSNQLVEETTEHEDDPTEISEFTEHSSSDTLDSSVVGNIETGLLLQQLLVDVPQQQQYEETLKQLKSKKRLEKARRRAVAKKGLLVKREVSNEHDLYELQYEVDDFAASIKNFEEREGRKAKRQELKLLK